MRVSEATEETPQSQPEGQGARQAAEREPKKQLTKKQRRKRAQRKQLITAGSIVVLVLVIIAGVVGYNRWKDGQIQTLPADQRITVVVDGKEQSVGPYSACELDDKDCHPGDPFTVHVAGAKEVKLKLPEDVYNHDWSLLQIYDNPGANQDNYYKSNEKKEITLPVEAAVKSEDGSTPKLTVVEVHSLLAGLDKNKEQTPFATIWSLEIAP